MNKDTKKSSKIALGLLSLVFGFAMVGILFGVALHFSHVRSLLGATATAQPSIANVTTSGLDAWSVEIHWDTPGFPSDSLVYYGTSPNTLSAQASQRCGADTGGLVTSHCVYIGLLAQNAMYYYKVRSSSGTSYGTTLILDTASSFTVPSIPVGSDGWENVPPTTPLHVTAQAISPTSAIISWLPSSDNSGMALTYKIVRNGSVIATSLVTNYTDSSLAQGTLYTYAIRAVDPSGNESPNSELTSATTPTLSSSDTSSVPPAPTSFTAVYNSAGTVSFTWTDTPNEYSFKVYARTQGSSGWTTQVGEYGKNSVAASTAAPPSGKYEYTIKACNGVGCSPESTIVSVSVNLCESADCDVTPPTKPTELHTTYLGPTHIDIAWNPSTDDVSVTKYKLYRSGSFAGDITGGTSYSDTSVAPGISYLYYVVAIDEVNHASDPSATLSVNVPYFEVATSTTTVAPAPLLITPSAPTATAQGVTVPIETTTTFTPFVSTLLRGSRGNEVVRLQNFLVTQGDLAADLNTGYFGPSTETALKKYQCAKGIVCSGSPSSTGYGLLGPTTRRIINAEL